jgi:hypothetical protein
VGYSRASISTSYATGQVFGSYWYTGGLVGGNAGSGSVSNSYATGAVNGSFGTGGLVGYSVETSSISNSYATGNVSGSANDVGGLAGGSYATISNSYATGQVNGSAVNVGGLVGIQDAGSISQSYATGAVSGPNAGGTIGGLLGRQDSGTVSASYWDTQTTGQNHSIGSADSFGLTTAQMMQASSFAGWDLATTGGTSSVWRIYEGHSAPLLRTLMTNLTVTANNVTNIYTGASYAGGAGVTYSSPPNANLLGAPGYGGTSQGAKNAGSYTITPSGYWSNQQGYDIAYTSGALVINPATLIYTADPASRPYGAANPAFTGNVTGFVGTDTLANATAGALFWSSAANVNSLFGSYAINGSGLTALNYIFAQAPGNASALTVPIPIWVSQIESARMFIAALTQGFGPQSSGQGESGSSDSGRSAMGYRWFTLPGQPGYVAPKLFTVVGSGVRKP